jgi:hypothetical protein
VSLDLLHPWLPAPPFALPGVPPAPPVRRLSARGRAGTALAAKGRAGTGLAAEGRADTRLATYGSVTVAVEKNLSCFRGEDVTLTLTMTPSVNVSGWSHLFRLLDAAGNVLVSKASGSGIAAGAATDQQVATLASADTDLNPATEAEADSWEWWRTGPGVMSKLAYGAFTIKGGPPPS